MIEQRKNQRFELQLPFEVLRLGDGTKVTGATMNISSSGVLFASEEPIVIGEPIEYLLALPKVPGTRAEVRLRCVGKVVREDSTLPAFAASLERYEFLRQPK
jgi:PilZ domain